MTRILELVAWLQREKLEHETLIEAAGRLLTEHALRESGGDVEKAERLVGGVTLPALDLMDLQRLAMVEALKRSLWVRARAARVCGMSRKGFNYTCVKLGIWHESWGAAPFTLVGKRRPTVRVLRGIGNAS